jgi:hypothetical protein
LPRAKKKQDGCRNLDGAAQMVWFAVTRQSPRYDARIVREQLGARKNLAARLHCIHNDLVIHYRIEVSSTRRSADRSMALASRHRKERAV